MEELHHHWLEWYLLTSLVVSIPELQTPPHKQHLIRRGRRGRHHNGFVTQGRRGQGRGGYMRVLDHFHVAGDILCFAEESSSRS